MLDRNCLLAKKKDVTVGDEGPAALPVVQKRSISIVQQVLSSLSPDYEKIVFLKERRRGLDSFQIYEHFLEHFFSDFVFINHAILILLLYRIL